MKPILITFFCFITIAAAAQNTYSIKGMVNDSTEKIALADASVVVINSSDSILVNFIRVSPEGTFKIDGLSSGKYALIVRYPQYADYVEDFTVNNDSRSKDFGSINLQLKSKLLRDVIIKGEVTAIKFKGDTTEYNARAFVIQPNDKVEDLLKQLPGIQVDKDGKITAQGQTISKVLVDGEEFFGDDPTLVTKNIRADMVDKVQLFDKKSDQAAFTGVDDGIKTKTLNVKLKEDKKYGYFGKLEAGKGTDGYYQVQGMYNAFKGKRKFALYTTNGNTGKTGLSFDDNQTYAYANNVQIIDGSVLINMTGGDNDLDSFDGRYNGQGIPSAKTGGAHYDNKWNADALSLNVNYKFGWLDVNGDKNVQTQKNFLKIKTNTVENQNFSNSIFRQKFDFSYQIALDTSSTLKITFDGTQRNNSTLTNYNAYSYLGMDTLQNKNIRDIMNSGHEHFYNAGLFYTKKFKKPNRTLSAYLGGHSDDSDSQGYLKSSTTYYNPSGNNQVDSLTAIDQYKTSLSKNNILYTNLTYTEPLGKIFTVVINYGLVINRSTSDRKSFNALVPNVYSALDAALSNNFNLNQTINQAGVIVNYKRKKTVLNFGSKVADVAFNQLNVNNSNTLNRHFVNWYPQFSYLYRISQQSNFSFNYNGNAQSPTIMQIQPIRTNTDPLNVFLGNTGLKPSFSNRFVISYSSYRTLTSQFFNIGGNFSYTTNQVINWTVTDVATGASTIQYVNLDKHKPYVYSFYTFWGRKIKGPDFNIGVSINVYGNSYYNYINNVLAQSTSSTYSGSVNLHKAVLKKYDFTISMGPTYNQNQSSLQKQFNGNSSGFNGKSSLSLYLPAKLQLATDITYTFVGKSRSFDENFKRTLWNATVSKSFLKENNLKLSLSAYDLLNQNNGFSRSASGNIITQSNFTTIRRYLMFSISWDFNQVNSKKQ
ncbi:outer membrane beta-barrel family protein [Mucilaginibacter sp. HD30]